MYAADDRECRARACIPPIRSMLQLLLRSRVSVAVARTFRGHLRGRRWLDGSILTSGRHQVVGSLHECVHHTGYPNSAGQAGGLAVCVAANIPAGWVGCRYADLVSGRRSCSDLPYQAWAENAPSGPSLRCGVAGVRLSRPDRCRWSGRIWAGHDPGRSCGRCGRPCFAAAVWLGSVEDRPAHRDSRCDECVQRVVVARQGSIGAHCYRVARVGSGSCGARFDSGRFGVPLISAGGQDMSRTFGLYPGVERVSTR